MDLIKQEDITMKYTFRFLALIAAASIVFFSCEKETASDAETEVPGTTDPSAQEETNPGENTQFDPDAYLLSFGAGFENDAKSKVDINIGTGTAGLTLEEGDEALVYNGEASAVYVYDGALFKSENPVALGSDCQVFYPAAEFSVSDNNVIFTMPNAVKDIEDLGKKNPLAGKITGSAGAYSVTFKAVGSILKVNVTGALDISGVKLQNAGSGRMPLGPGAEFTIGWDEDLPTMTANESGTNSEMSVSRNVTLNDTPETFYYIVPAGVAYKNVTVQAQFSSGSIGGSSIFDISRGDWTAERNKVYTMSFYAGLFSGGEGTEGAPYLIDNARDFKHISEYCTNGYGVGPDAISAAYFLDAHYKQTADFNFKNADLSDYMIGSDSDKFSGTYDGDEHALSNFSITGKANYTGLWRYADGASFSDIRIQGAGLTSTYEDTGIIAGRADNSSVSNCIATTTTVSGSTQRTGGLFGMVEGGSLTGCIFGAETAGDSDGSSVTGGGNTGGLVGLCDSDMTNCSNIKAAVNGGSGTANGGVAGSVRAAVTLKNCTNSGAVKASKDYNGGIVGYATVAACTLDGCSNSGNVTAGTGNKYIGGVVGMINIAGVSISNCTNSGSVTKGYDIGGIVGYVDAADIDITSCVNSGSVTAQNTSNNSCAGGIVGWSNNNNVTIVLCDNNGAVTASRANVGGIVGEIVGGKIDRCTNRANVEITDAAQNNAGGVGGYVHGTTYIKRCYSGKVTIKGGTRIGGIVGNLIDASQIVNCAVFSQIRGARTGAVGNYGIGTIAGCQSGTSLIANCLARDNGVHVQNTGSDTQLAGGIVGFRNGGTLQNCFTAGVLNNIRSKTKNGPALGAYVGQVCGKSTAGIIKDCYYRGHGQGARALGTATSGTTTDNVTLVSTNATTGYSYTTVPVEVTTSTGTQYAANTVYLKDLLNGGLTDDGISGYTPEEGEDMTWTDHVLSTGYEGYPFPSALATLGAKFYDN